MIKFEILFIAVIIIVSSTIANSQIKATTENGKIVILNQSDMSWEYDEEEIIETDTLGNVETAECLTKEDPFEGTTKTTAYILSSGMNDPVCTLGYAQISLIRNGSNYSISILLNHAGETFNESITSGQVVFLNKDKSKTSLSFNSCQFGKAKNVSQIKPEDIEVTMSQMKSIVNSEYVKITNGSVESITAIEVKDYSCLFK